MGNSPIQGPIARFTAGVVSRQFVLTSAVAMLAFGAGWFGRDVGDEARLWWTYWRLDLADRPPGQLPEALEVSGAGYEAVNGTYYLYNPGPEFYCYTRHGEAPGTEPGEIWFEAVEGVGWDLWSDAMYLYYHARGTEAWWSPGDDYMPDEPASPADLEWTVGDHGQPPVPDIQPIAARDGPG
ncbi:MAG: hypothetical protein ACODAQ_05945 [Phycisphaeraceae bacterium]